MAWDRLLVFGSAGFALTDLQEHFHYNDNAGSGREKGTLSKTKPGWAAGGGLEYALMDNVSVRAEYLHVDFGRESQREDTFHIPGGPTFPATNLKHSIELNAEIARFAVNYLF